MVVIVLSAVRQRVWSNSVTRGLRDAGCISIAESTTTNVEVKEGRRTLVRKCCVKGDSAALRALNMAGLSISHGGTSVLPTDARWV